MKYRNSCTVKPAHSASISSNSSWLTSHLRHKSAIRMFLSFRWLSHSMTFEIRLYVFSVFICHSNCYKVFSPDRHCNTVRLLTLHRSPNRVFQKTRLPNSIQFQPISYLGCRPKIHPLPIFCRPLPSGT